MASKRADGPFVAVNVAALLEENVDRELFGQIFEDSAGIKRLQPGKFTIANRGTLFLDGIGNMSMTVQAKFLRALENGEIESVGSSDVVSVSVRIIATTSANLEQLVKEGAFREDLFYRLAVLPISVAPLRGRTEDVDVLVEMMLDELRSELGGYLISDEAMQLLRAHAWPGNVRELRNVLERASLEAIDGTIGTKEIAWALQSPGPGSEGLSGGSFQVSLSDSLRRAEKTAIIGALLKSKGNREEAAAMLGISRSCLYGKLKSLGVGQL